MITNQPPEIINNIFNYLPKRDKIASCVRVCKKWFDIIDTDNCKTMEQFILADDIFFYDKFINEKYIKKKYANICAPENIMFKNILSSVKYLSIVDGNIKKKISEHYWGWGENIYRSKSITYYLLWSIEFGFEILSKQLYDKYLKQCVYADDINDRTAIYNAVRDNTKNICNLFDITEPLNFSDEYLYHHINIIMGHINNLIKNKLSSNTILQFCITSNNYVFMKYFVNKHPGENIFSDDLLFEAVGKNNLLIVKLICDNFEPNYQYWEEYFMHIIKFINLYDLDVLQYIVKKINFDEDSLLKILNYAVLLQSKNNIWLKINDKHAEIIIYLKKLIDNNA